MTGQLAAPQRMFAHRRILQMTPAAFLAGMQLLAESIEFWLGPASAVIGVANGGLPPAHVLGELLALPVYRVDARHNPTDAIYTPATGQVTYDVHRLYLRWPVGNWPGGYCSSMISAGREPRSVLFAQRWRATSGPKQPSTR